MLIIIATLISSRCFAVAKNKKKMGCCLDRQTDRLQFNAWIIYLLSCVETKLTILSPIPSAVCHKDHEAHNRELYRLWPIWSRELRVLRESDWPRTARPRRVDLQLSVPAAASRENWPTELCLWVNWRRSLVTRFLIQMLISSSTTLPSDWEDLVAMRMWPMGTEWVVQWSSKSKKERISN